ncbi:MAG: GTPase HflX, partial [Planctomycetaceae bacterium]|nr:GTPase HflX [Planctomycetaceae bacterium]
HLERQRAAVGAVGGAGERQIETDRRLLRNRISALKKELQDIGRRRAVEVERRHELFQVSIVGYTNAGKSTLMNALTDEGVLTEDKLFATLDTRTCVWKLPDHKVLLSDTVGFIRNLPHRLVASFHATLEEVLHADLLLHVVDASHPAAIEMVNAVNSVLKEVGADDRRTLMVL